MSTLNYCQKLYDNQEPASFYAAEEPDWENMSDGLYNWYIKQTETN